MTEQRTEKEGDIDDRRSPLCSRYTYKLIAGAIDSDSISSE